MRIISGIYGGRRLSPPKNITARPTTDFAKESLFNLLNNRLDFEDSRMLDLFAGTGSIGLEFVSRGARQVTADNWVSTISPSSGATYSAFSMLPYPARPDCMTSSMPTRLTRLSGCPNCRISCCRYSKREVGSYSNMAKTMISNNTPASARCGRTGVYIFPSSNNS